MPINMLSESRFVDRESNILDRKLSSTQKETGILGPTSPPERSHPALSPSWTRIDADSQHRTTLPTPTIPSRPSTLSNTTEGGGPSQKICKQRLLTHSLWGATSSDPVASLCQNKKIRHMSWLRTQEDWSINNLHLFLVKHVSISPQNNCSTNWAGCATRAVRFEVIMPYHIVRYWLSTLYTKCSCWDLIIWSRTHSSQGPRTTTILPIPMMLQYRKRS